MGRFIEVGQDRESREIGALWIDGVKITHEGA